MRRVLVVFLVSFLATTVGATAADAQPAGKCALCEGCFTCSGGLEWGVDNCDMGGSNPECPCQNLGQACNPQFALGSEVEAAEIEVAGATVHLLRLDDAVFGQFDCASGNLTGVYAAGPDGRQLVRVAESTLAIYRQRFHLSNYLDETGVLPVVATYWRSAITSDDS